MATKWEANMSAKINGLSADKVWPLLANFGNIYKFFPTDVSFCVEGISGQPGQVRYSAIKAPSPADESITTVQWAREKLLEIDACQRFLKYEILENNRGIKEFTASMQIFPIDDHGCTFKWLVIAEPIDGVTNEDFLAIFNAIFEVMVENIENLFVSS